MDPFVWVHLYGNELSELVHISSIWSNNVQNQPTKNPKGSSTIRPLQQCLGVVGSILILAPMCQIVQLISALSRWRCPLCLTLASALSTGSLGCWRDLQIWWPMCISAQRSNKLPSNNGCNETQV